MTAALVCVFSTATLVHFAVSSWRAGLLSVAAQPLSEEIATVAGISSNSLKSNDFHSLSSLHEMCPELHEASCELRLVRLYYRAIEALGWLCDAQIPTFHAWASREMATCTRYLAVRMDERVKRNRACLADLGTY